MQQNTPEQQRHHALTISSNVIKKYETGEYSGINHVAVAMLEGYLEDSPEGPGVPDLAENELFKKALRTAKTGKVGGKKRKSKKYKKKSKKNKKSKKRKSRKLSKKR